MQIGCPSGSSAALSSEPPATGSQRTPRSVAPGRVGGRGGRGLVDFCRLLCFALAWEHLCRNPVAPAVSPPAPPPASRRSDCLGVWSPPSALLAGHQAGLGTLGFQRRAGWRAGCLSPYKEALASSRCMSSSGASLQTPLAQASPVCAAEPPGLWLGPLLPSQAVLGPPLAVLSARSAWCRPLHAPRAAPPSPPSADSALLSSRTASGPVCRRHHQRPGRDPLTLVLWGRGDLRLGRPRLPVPPRLGGAGRPEAAGGVSAAEPDLR